MPAWPRGLHRQTGTQAARMAASRRILVTGQDRFDRPQQVPLTVAGQQVVNAAGSAFVALGPSGTGTRWYVSQVQVSTSTGPDDQSAIALYLGTVAPTALAGQSAQGGGDTLAVTVPMQPGDRLVCLWTGGTPGDTATMVVYGDQVVLT